MTHHLMSLMTLPSRFHKMYPKKMKYFLRMMSQMTSCFLLRMSRNPTMSLCPKMKYPKKNFLQMLTNRTMSLCPTSNRTMTNRLRKKMNQMMNRFRLKSFLL